MNSKTYRVLASRIPELASAIDHLAKKAARLRLSPITMEVGEPVDVPTLHIENATYTFWEAKHGDLATLEAEGRIRYRRFHDVTILGDRPRLAGWEFCATLQHLETEDGQAITMLRVAPGVDGDLPEKYRTATAENCDHCRRRIRNRKDTYILRHIESGKWMQVGRSCTQDFLGGQNPHDVAAQLDMLLLAAAAAESASEDNGGGGGGGRLESRWPLREFLAVVATFVRTDGWISRGRARAAGDFSLLSATADDAVKYLSPPPLRDSQARDDWKKWAAAHPVTEADKATAVAALNFARSDLADKASRSDYEHNLLVACSLASVDARLAGIVASLIPYHLREIEQLVERTAAKESQHIGTVGERLTLEVTLGKIIPLEGGVYGPTYLHKLIATDGARLVWFASNKGDMIEGQNYTVKATVKAHSERDDTKQTVVTRLSVLTEEAAAKEHAKAERAAKRAAKSAAKI